MQHSRMLGFATSKDQSYTLRREVLELLPSNMPSGWVQRLRGLQGDHISMRSCIALVFAVWLA